jgi:hypothetical protein
VAGFAVVVLAAMTSGDGPSLHLPQRLVLFAVLVASVLWIAALLYVVWTPYGAHVVVSLQGRYLIPLGPLAFLPLSNRRWRIDWDRHGSLLAAWAASFLCVALAATAARFYR